VLKVTGMRCNLRSWTQADYDAVIADENGGTKKGKMPLDAFYNSPCTPSVGPTAGSGYTGYSITAATLGGTCVVVDRRNNQFYLGMNIKSRLPDGNPDFEPTVIAFDVDGGIRWWSRLYHEINPAGVNQNSSPDQYVDALALDYANDNLVVVARCHGNNVENLWEGNTVAANAAASGFQNRFTGTNGNIHLQWIGKMRTTDGQLQRSTYMGEYVEGTNNYGTAHPDPNMDGFPNPNAGWPNINTTRIPRNTVRTTADGSVCLVASGRRTMTTANAHQKMPLPSSGLVGCWNDFVRVYNPNLTVPLYSSLVVGQWSTVTGVGGDNVELFGVWKTQSGVVAVGRANSGGNAIPTANVPVWGAAAENGAQSAVLAYLSASNLFNSQDGAAVVVPVELINFSGNTEGGKNYLKWQTASEINSRDFEVERSSDGKIFEKIGSVKAKGSGSNYTFSDKDFSQNLNYYRLKINDLDGSFTFSKNISLEVKNREGSKMRLYPNPVTDVLTIENPMNGDIEIVNALGQVVITTRQVEALIKLDVNHLPNGVYFVKMGRETLRFVKK
jgi:hypothetical protein